MISNSLDFEVDQQQDGNFYYKTIEHGVSKKYFCYTLIWNAHERLKYSTWRNVCESLHSFMATYESEEEYSFVESQLFLGCCSSCFII